MKLLPIILLSIFTHTHSYDPATPKPLNKQEPIRLEVSYGIIRYVVEKQMCPDPKKVTCSYREIKRGYELTATGKVLATLATIGLLMKFKRTGRF